MIRNQIHVRAVQSMTRAENSDATPCGVCGSKVESTTWARSKARGERNEERDAAVAEIRKRDWRAARPTTGQRNKNESELPRK